MLNEFSINLLTSEQNQLEKYCTYFKNVNKPIVLFGAGAIGLSYANYFKKQKITNQLFFCDNNTDKQGMLIDGIPIISFMELKTMIQNSYIIITSFQYYDAIFNQLKENNLLDNLIDLPAHKLSLGYYNIVSKNIQKFKRTFTLLADDYSKRIFYERINFCISLNSSYLTPLKSKSPQYFESEIINLSEDEVFIDGGAYTGDTVEEFLRQTNGKYKKIYSFEPEEIKRYEFLKKFSSMKDISFQPFGLWNKKDVLRFNAQGGLASKLSKNGEHKIPVTSIDEFLSGEEASFIKMDIEGAELEALIGARKTIRNFKPKLAICVYHKPLDIVEIPLYIKQLVPEYKLFLRHYSNNLYDTILYAIPE